MSRDLRETKRSFGEDRKEKNSLNTLLDDLNKEQELLRNQLATSNIQRSQVESKLNQTLALYEQANKQSEAQSSEIIEKIAQIGELEGRLSQAEMDIKDKTRSLDSLRTKFQTLESLKNQTHNDASKECGPLSTTS